MTRLERVRLPRCTPTISERPVVWYNNNMSKRSRPVPEEGISICDSKKGSLRVDSHKSTDMLTSSFSTSLETVLREITIHAEAQCSIEEIAAITGVPMEQLETDKAKEILAKSNASGRAKLRKALFARAIGGVDDMMMPIAPQKEVAVWLSKQYLDMKDKQEVKQDGTIKLILEKI